jgi:BlaI family transcriptional regulator, penicillinase repressor
MMTKLAALSKSELEISRIVWRLGNAKVREVVEALPADRQLDFFTVQTYLRRLKAKGYLKTRREGRADVYFPAVKPTSVIREVIADFVDRTFGGDAGPLMQHLIEDRGLSDAEIDQLQDALDELKRRRKS